MEIAKLAGCAIVACVLVIIVHQYKPELAMLVSIASGVFMLALIIKEIIPIVNRLNTLIDAANADADALAIVLKAFGICLLAQLAADICRDSGQSAIAMRIEMAGKVAIVLLALPLLEQVFELSVNIINGV